jgi:hypothetical protein
VYQLGKEEGEKRPNAPSVNWHVPLSFSTTRGEEVDINVSLSGFWRQGRLWLNQPPIYITVKGNYLRWRTLNTPLVQCRRGILKTGYLTIMTFTRSKQTPVSLLTSDIENPKLAPKEEFLTPPVPIDLEQIDSIRRQEWARKIRPTH